MTHSQTQGAEGADDAGTEWFWRIVAANGLGNVPSDEGEALRLLCLKASRYDEGQSASSVPPGVRSLLHTARSGLATYGAGAFEGTIAQIDAILAFDPTTPAPAATPGVPDSVRALSEAASPGEATFEIVPYHLGDTGDTDLPGFLRLGGVQVAEVHEKYGPGVDPRYEADGKFIAAAVNHVRTLIAAQPAGQSTDDGTDRCEVCNKPLIAGQRVMQDVELGTVHAACCGPEREAYVKDVETGEPLGPNDPIPQGYVYEGEEPAGQERPDRKWVCNGDPAAHPAGQAGDAGAVQRANFFEMLWRDAEDEAQRLEAGMKPSRDQIAEAFHEHRRERQPNLPPWSDVDQNSGAAQYAHTFVDRLLSIRPEEPAPDSTRTGVAETDRERIPLSPGYHAEPGETPGHQHDIYTTVPPLCGWSRIHVGTLMKQAVEAWATLVSRPAAPDMTGIGEPTEPCDCNIGDCKKFRMYCLEERQTLAARPEAPSDAGWSFDMEAAPRDGTVILLWRKEWGEPSAAYWGLAPMADGAGIATKRHPWVFLDSTNGVNGYEDGGHGPMAWRSMLDAPTPPSDPAPSGQAEG